MIQGGGSCACREDSFLVAVKVAARIVLGRWFCFIVREQLIASTFLRAACSTALAFLSQAITLDIHSEHLLTALGACTLKPLTLDLRTGPGLEKQS